LVLGDHIARQNAAVAGVDRDEAIRVRNDIAGIYNLRKYIIQITAIGAREVGTDRATPAVKPVAEPARTIENGTAVQPIDFLRFGGREETSVAGEFDSFVLGQRRHASPKRRKRRS